MDDRTRRISQLRAEIAARAADDAIVAAALAIVRARQQARGEAATKEELELTVRMGLTIGKQSDTLDPMDATETANARMSRARISRTARKHPFVQAFVERGETVAQAAEKLGYPRTSVQSWYRTDENARPIPRAAAQKALKLYGVPLTAWQKLGE